MHVLTFWIAAVGRSIRLFHSVRRDLRIQIYRTNREYLFYNHIYNYHKKQDMNNSDIYIHHHYQGSGWLDINTNIVLCIGLSRRS